MLQVYTPDATQLLHFGYNNVTNEGDSQGRGVCVIVIKESKSLKSQRKADTAPLFRFSIVPFL